MQQRDDQKALLFVLSFTRPLFAQEGNAALTGVIQDSSKAFLADVSVLTINTDTNQHFETTTGKDGSYNIASLPVGICRPVPGVCARAQPGQRPDVRSPNRKLKGLHP
jgi:hypothetical protein